MLSCMVRYRIIKIYGDIYYMGFFDGVLVCICDSNGNILIEYFVS